MNRPLWLSLVSVALCLGAFSSVWGDPAHDEIALKISRALTHHLEGDDATAADLLEAALLELRPSAPPLTVGPDVPHSNAAQLLDYLDVYALHALGEQPPLDRAYEVLRAELLRIDAIHAHWPRPAKWDGAPLDFDPFSHLVERIGDVEVDYDPFRHQIRKIGRFEIDYDPFHHRPVDIGGIEFEYDPFSRRLVEVAGVRLP